MPCRVCIAFSSSNPGRSFTPFAVCFAGEGEGEGEEGDEEDDDDEEGEEGEEEEGEEEEGEEEEGEEGEGKENSALTLLLGVLRLLFGVCGVCA